METFSGRRLDLLEPDPATVRLEDVAHHLARVNRYNGATRPTISVAEHCCVLADYAHVFRGFPAEAGMLALVHDGHEAYTGDFIKPLKLLIGEPLKKIERRVQAAVLAGLGLGLGPMLQRMSRFCELVAELDARVLLDERAAGMPNHPGDGAWAVDGLEPLGAGIHFWPPEVAEAQFLGRWAFYADSVGLVAGRAG
jgi:hypothetical protein